MRPQASVCHEQQAAQSPVPRVSFLQAVLRRHVKTPLHRDPSHRQQISQRWKYVLHWQSSAFMQTLSYMHKYGDTLNTDPIRSRYFEMEMYGITLVDYVVSICGISGVMAFKVFH